MRFFKPTSGKIYLTIFLAFLLFFLLPFLTQGALGLDPFSLVSAALETAPGNTFGMIIFYSTIFIVDYLISCIIVFTVTKVK